MSVNINQKLKGNALHIAPNFRSLMGNTMSSVGILTRTHKNVPRPQVKLKEVLAANLLFSENLATSKKIFTFFTLKP